MNAAELKELQTPIKARYRDDPNAAVITLKARGAIGEGVTCSVETGRQLVEAGLHPAPAEPGCMPVPATCSSRHWSLVRV